MTDRDIRNPEKIYAKVRADFLPDGRIIPLIFRVGDEEAVRIDRVLDARQAPSLKLGGQGMRYTCQAGDRRYYLFNDQGRWFVEPLVT